MTDKRSTDKKDNNVLQINVSKTKLEAAILLTEPTDGRVLSTKDIIQELNEKGIIFGINRDKIKEMIQGNIFNQNIIVAQGKPPINGDDARVVYIFSNESDVSIPGTIGRDGRIDYKTLNKIRNVKAGDLLIEIVPPTQGISGTDVYGNEIVAKKGNPAVIKKGKNVKEGKNGLKIYATGDGEVCFKDNTIYVDEVITIDGNIDNETGNIQFNGKVNIRGNVKSGFKVEADGDIEIFGVVEGATLISGGNIIIHRGIQGNGQAHLYCSGDFKSKYIENAHIKSEGNVEADVILHSDIIAQNRIIASGKKGLIVGGNIKAGKKVGAKVLGSNMGTNTVIEVGIDPKERDNYEQLKGEIESVGKSIEDSRKAIDLLNKMAKQQQLTGDKEDILAKLLITYEILKKKYSTLTEEMQILSGKFQSAKGGKICASVAIYPGVRAVIGNSVRQIYDELHNSTLHIEDGEVTIGPYEK
ncbi:MAG TPA: FapA family protein [Clostridia bacterium]|nr:FapA family protein [Clostridia bacterium]